MNGNLEVKVVAKYRGLWKLAFLTFLMRHKSQRHDVHIHITDDDQPTRCITHGAQVLAAKLPSLTGQ